ncbi:MAG: hypothetical protein AABW81_03370, partial [Nanoarchaeota archaeon]
MKQKEWMIVIAVIIIVAVIVSLATVRMSGNVIKQNNNFYGQYQVYTKQEIDARIATITSPNQTIVTKEGILRMLNKCSFIGFNLLGNITHSCNQICSNSGRICISCSFEEYKT